MIQGLQTRKLLMTHPKTHIIGSLIAFGFRYLNCFLSVLNSKNCIEEVQSVEEANNQKHSSQKTFKSFDL